MLLPDSIGFAEELTTLVADQTYPFAIALYGGQLDWANTGDNTAATGTIMRADLTGSNVTTLVTGQSLSAGVAVAP